MMFIMTEFQASTYWINKFSFGKSSSIMRLRDKAMTVKEKLIGIHNTRFAKGFAKSDSPLGYM